MNKFSLRVLLTAAAMFIGQLAFCQKSEPRMDIEKCRSFINACDSIVILPEQYDFLIGQCRILADRYMDEVKRIKRIDSLEGRKEAADSINHAWREEYGVYDCMIRILKEAVKDESNAEYISRLNSIEAEHLLNDNLYLNRMFTIFRSHYEFR